MAGAGAHVLRGWLKATGRWREGEAKPRRPKESLEMALRLARVRRSSALYRRLAEHVSLTPCRDRAFLRCRKVVRQWFPAPGRE